MTSRTAATASTATRGPRLWNRWLSAGQQQDRRQQHGEPDVVVTGLAIADGLLEMAGGPSSASAADYGRWHSRSPT